MIHHMRLVFSFLVFHSVALTAKAKLPEEKLFRTLDCNANLATAECVSWKTTFGDVFTQDGEISIPCGQCINLDVAGDLLVLTGGLNVIGKLVISTPIDIETPHVIVQGELLINSNKIWDGTQDITITLTGTGSKTFLPADSNASKCGGNPCSVGKKPFVVAGGKLLVDGMPSSDYDTPTWVHIQDVKADLSGSGSPVVPVEAYPGLKVSEICPTDGIFIAEDFSSPSLPSTDYDVESSLGSQMEYTVNSLKSSGRKHVSQGPVFDLIAVMSCIMPDVRYQINARVKTYREETGPNVVEDSDCMTDGSGCLDIRFQYERADTYVKYKTPYHEETNYDWQYGEEIFISETIVFDADMLNPTNIFNTFAFRGLLPGVDIEIYEFEFKLAPEEAYRSSTDICPDLALPNGDAELDPLSPFPYKADAYYTNVIVVQDDENLSNHFFRISGRGNSHHNSLRWETGVGCMTANAVYRVKMDYRLHPTEEKPNPEDYGFRVRLKVKRESNSDSWFEIARCNSDVEQGVWQTCDKIYTVPDNVVMEGDLQYEIVLEAERLIDYDVDNISIVQTTGPINTVTVVDSVDGKWGAGAEVLITSHTTSWNDEQVRTITEIVASEESGYVNIILNETIKAPTTIKDDSNYATEIAILSRNIKLQGAEDDSDVLHGGHLMVLATPGDGQDIVGLEVTNMGQAGNLGRYPLHFHLCGDVTGSRLAKNLIRETNQRCAVVHGTDHLLVDNNVAYDTFGHCFMVEDGFERFNTFSNNLGARTKRATQVIPNLPAKLNGDETDHSAATFWISNPTNFFENNVAAGGEFSGFWFELRHRPRGSMSEMYDLPEWHLRSRPLGSFKGNVAHSYDSAGIRTYPNGYAPENVAVFDGSRSYRNSNSGMFIHNSQNITLKGFHFADNEQGVDVDRVDLFEMHDSVIIGRSEDYKNKVLAQKARNVCAGNPSYVRGVEMHTFRHSRTLLPTLQGKFQNVRFSGFNDTGCDVSAVFWADDEVRVGSWDYWTTLEGSTVDGVSEGQIANFCRAVNVGIADSYIIDKDSAFRDSLGSTGPSTIMTHTNTHTKLQSFIDPTMCQDYPENCYSYCENTCLRTVTFRVDPSISDEHKLKICKKDDPLNRCEIFDNWYNHDTLDRFRIFSPGLPVGSYTAEFLHDNQVTWPRGLNVTYEVDMCNGGGLLEGGIELMVPEVDASQCQNLISNGDAEESNSDPKSWVYERDMGLEIVQAAGLLGSNAFGDLTSTSDNDGLTQHLDTRCLSLNRGRQYEVKAYVKLIDGNGQSVYCDPSIKHSWGCPRIMLNYGVYRKTDEIWRRDLEIEAGLTRARYVNEDGYQLVQGIVTIDDRFADATNVRLYVERRANNKEMFVDNVSMTLVSQSTCDVEEELVSNGAFDDGTSAFWNDHDAEGLQIVSPGVGGSGHALRMTTGSVQQSIKSTCIESGKRYMATAKYRLMDGSGNPIVCNPASNSPRCPEMSLNAYDENTAHIEYVHAIARPLDSTTNTDDGFSTLWGIYEPSDKIGSAADVRLLFVNTGANMILDNVSFKEIGNGLTSLGEESSSTSTCGEVIVNGDNELGVTSFWSGSGVRDDKILTTTGLGGGVAARVTGRNHYSRGMWYSGERYVNKEDCLAPSSSWKLSGDIRLLLPNTETGADCDTSESVNTDTRCPRVRVRFYDEGDPYTHIREEVVHSYTAEWNKDGWNKFEGRVDVPALEHYTINKISIVVAEARAEIDIAVDNLSMVPMP